MTATTAPVGLCRGTVVESIRQRLILSIPGTDYRLHLIPTPPVDAQPGDRIRGRINVRSRRIDITRQGGAFIDPVMGRPCTIQGRVASVGDEDQTLVVESAVPVLVRVAPPQKPTDFTVGMFITFAVEPGATFAAIQRT